jgi:hypothetical protein
MKMGALWLRQAKDGQTYMSGVIEYPGMKLQFAVFRNDEKQKDNQPDYNIIWNPPQEGGQGNGGGFTGQGFPQGPRQGFPQGNTGGNGFPQQGQNAGFSGQRQDGGQPPLPQNFNDDIPF